MMSTSGCSKKFEDMTDDEKAAFELDHLDLSEQEKADQIRVRKAILERVNDSKSGEEKISRAMDNARKVLSEADMLKLEEAQKTWERQGRGKEMNAMAAKGIAAADAYGLSLHARADWIETRASWAMLIDMPGAFGGLYKSGDRMAEVYEMPAEQINLVIRGSEFVFTATGKVQDDRAVLASESDPRASVTLTRDNAGNLTSAANADFGASKFVSIRPLTEGYFVRIKSGEIDVFAP